LDDEQEHTIENSTKEKAYTMWYQPLESNILIVLVFITPVFSANVRDKQDSIQQTGVAKPLHIIFFSYNSLR
jgi:hypothetical protein